MADDLPDLIGSSDEDVPPFVESRNQLNENSTPNKASTQTEATTSSQTNKATNCWRRRLAAVAGRKLNDDDSDSSYDDSDEDMLSLLNATNYLRNMLPNLPTASSSDMM